jgi:hypothetical protein
MNDKKITKKLEKINKLIAENNAAFKKATKAQKRVMIAQDVLAQIKAKRYVAEPGRWVVPTFSENFCNTDDYPDTVPSVQQLFASKEIESCNVCALGGLFMSCTNLNNHTTYDQFNDESEDIGSLIGYEEGLSNELDVFFSKNQLTLIEIYFEDGEGYFSIDNETVDTGSRFYKSIDFDHVNSFNDKYQDDDDRLKAIMKNIVENNGTFVPEKLKV